MKYVPPVRPLHTPLGVFAIPRPPRPARASTAEPLERRVALSGVTLITHGAQLDRTYPQWVSAMATAVADAAGTPWQDVTWYSVEVSGPGSPSAAAPVRVAGPPAQDSPTGEVVITLDWSDVAGLTPVVTPARQVAEAVAPVLLAQRPEFGGSFAQLPLHLVGHSRGAPVIAEIARLLGEAGVWVDQVTTLDPHPIAGDPGPTDSATVWDNVIFADNYYEDAYFIHGGPVSGAQNVGPLALPGGSNDHSDVHTWYHGTIDTATAGPVDGVMIEPSWYAPPAPARTQAGYAWSRVGQAKAGAPARPAVGLRTGFGGSAFRQATSRAPGFNSQWPNVADVGTVESGARFPVGQPLTARYKHQDRDTASSVNFFLDRDRNPFNNNHTPVIGQEGFLPADEQPAPLDETTPLNTAGLSPGRYYLFARVNEVVVTVGRTRYAYAAAPIDLVDGGPAVTRVTVGNGDGNVSLIRQVVVMFDRPGVTADQGAFVLTRRGGETVNVTATPGPTDGPSTYIVTFSGPQTADGGALVNGSYDLRVLASLVHDGGGQAMARDFTGEFFALRGDVDGNRAVNTNDFVLLAANFGKSGRTYAQGDVDGDGVVNSNDFVLLAANFGRTVPPAPPPAAPASVVTAGSAVPVYMPTAPQSRGAAQENSPRRKPWVHRGGSPEPRRGGRRLPELLTPLRG